ncbi:Chalcone isomerase [Flavobacterium sp. 9AF]|uniref:chalcone isomerase family protein n=1 Tax=Flavobacterium sp. 9AF TaxID=2653142 RepID=UPI0012F34672|nr:chalcone isomerase family protein [Flavobacterium sp. 9AF]VXA96067.1 Chalcone isomerase [Flavobacterium sp. 9AF]
MRKLYLLLTFTMLPLVCVTAQSKLSGVSIYETLSFAGNRLVLNGAGVKERMWIDMYVASLYVPAKTSNADQIINSTEPAIIKINVVSGLLKADRMKEMFDEGFKNSMNGSTDALKTEIEKFISFFDNTMKENDEFMIVYNPKSGITVFKNSVKRGVIEGHDFKKALFGVWLCVKPADEKLKKAMLGL